MRLVSSLCEATRIHLIGAAKGGSRSGDTFVSKEKMNSPPEKKQQKLAIKRRTSLPPLLFTTHSLIIRTLHLSI